MDVVLASGNAGKLRELGVLLEPLGLTLAAQSAFDIPSPPEDAATFVENALIKARHAAGLAGRPAIADDSGLAVAALNGAPGVHSARYAGDDASDADNVEKLLAAMSGITDRRCEFVSVMVFLNHADDPLPLIATGRWPGTVLDAPRGSEGFGYDPVFGVPGLDRSAAELSAAEKNQRSHRGQAARDLVSLIARGLDAARAQ